jgi:uncharacterized protein (DUF1778 family)
MRVLEKETHPPQKTKRQANTAKAFSFRMDVETRALIDRAAEVIGQNRTDFVLTSARKRATDVLLDQTLFRLNKADWKAFISTLDEPPSDNDELKKLLGEKAPWQK